MSAALSRRVTVLFTSVGNEAIHGFVDDLRRRAPRWRLVGVDIRADAAGLFRCDVARLVPRSDAADYLPTLRALCEEQGVDVIFPLSTRDQDLFARSDVQAAFAPRPVVVSSAGAVAAANGKIALWEALSCRPHLRGVGEAAEDAKSSSDLVRRYVEDHGAAVVKDDRGTGSSGMLFFGQPPVDLAPAAGRRFLPLDQLDAALPVDGWPRLVCAWLPGREYSVDVLADAGRTVASVVRLRHRATGGLATVAETVDEPDVDAAAREVVDALGLSYVNNVQFRRDADGVPRILEVNPRIPGTIALTVEAGLNLPLAAICQALSEPLFLPVPEPSVTVSRFAGAAFARGLPDRSPSVLPSPCAILIDLDRTLVDLRIEWASVARWKESLRARFEPRIGEFRPSPLMQGIEDALRRLGEVAGPAEALRVRQEVFAELDAREDAECQGFDPHDDVIAAVLSLPGPKAIVTNNGPTVAARALGVVAERARALHVAMPSAVVCRAPELPPKPSSAPLRVAMERLRDPARPFRAVLMIGDSDHDAWAADALRADLPIPVGFARVGPGFRLPEIR